jgi:hypothetical protein
MYKKNDTQFAKSFSKKKRHIVCETHFTTLNLRMRVNVAFLSNILEVLAGRGFQGLSLCEIGRAIATFNVRTYTSDKRLSDWVSESLLFGLLSARWVFLDRFGAEFGVSY